MIYRIRTVQNGVEGEIKLFDFAGSEQLNQDQSNHDATAKLEAIGINFTILLFKQLIIRRLDCKKGAHKVNLSQSLGLPLLSCLREILQKKNNETRQKKIIFIANITPNVIDVKQTQNTLV